MADYFAKGSEKCQLLSTLSVNEVEKLDDHIAVQIFKNW